MSIVKTGLMSGALKPKPKLILTEFQDLTLSTPSLVLYIFRRFHSLAPDPREKEDF